MTFLSNSPTPREDCLGVTAFFSTEISEHEISSSSSWLNYSDLEEGLSDSGFSLWAMGSTA